MKRILTTAFFAGILVASVAWYGVEKIEWTHCGRQIFSSGTTNNYVEFGLRADGIVVWRKITCETNSPQEQGVIITNIIFDTPTNSIILCPGPTNNYPWVIPLNAITNYNIRGFQY